MATRLATEGYCVQSNNGDAESTTAKTLTEVKIKRSSEGLVTKIRILGVRRSHGTVKRKSHNSEEYEGDK